MQAGREATPADGGRATAGIYSLLSSGLGISIARFIVHQRTASADVAGSMRLNLKKKEEKYA